MNEQFVIFKSFNDPKLAFDLTELLKKENIPYEIEDTSSPIDPVIIGSSLEQDIKIKIQSKDFKQAHSVLEKQFESLSASVDQDYYLFSFSNNELLEIIENPFDWGELDYQLAKRILNERGVNLEIMKVESLKTISIQKMSRPEDINRQWIFFGYFLSIFISPIGIIYGSSISSLKKVLPDGQKVFLYTSDSRDHGKNIFLLSSIFTVLWAILAVL